MTSSGEDITDVLLENKLLFEQLNEFKSSERQHLNERKAVEDLLDDEYTDLKSSTYHEIVFHFIERYHQKHTEYERAIGRAIEKEGEVITTKAKLNSVQQHCKIAQLKLEDELRSLKDKAKNDKDRQSLSLNEQLALLVQERNTARANENALAERVSELMDEIVRLNQEIARTKQQKLDMSLEGSSAHEEHLQLRRELVRLTEEDEAMIGELQMQLQKRNLRCSELEEEVIYLQKRSESQRQEMQSAGDNSSSLQIETFQYKAKIKDYSEQITVLHRQLGTLKEANNTLNTDNQILAEKFVALGESYGKKEDSLRDLSRDYRYKLEELEKRAQLEKEKHLTIEVQYDEVRGTLVKLQTELNTLRAQTNRASRAKSDLLVECKQLRDQIDILKRDKEELLRQATLEDETLHSLLKKQENQGQAREDILTQNLAKTNTKLQEAEAAVDTKEGQIRLLEHQITELTNSVRQAEDSRVKSQHSELAFQKRAIEAEKNAEILASNAEELKREMNENLVQLECCENELDECKQEISKIEVYTGTEMRHLYSNVALVANIGKLRDWTLDSNQIIGNNKRKIDAINVEVRSAHEQNQQLKEKLHVAENDNSSLRAITTSTKAHLDSSHKELRQLRETVLKGEKGKRVMERRVHAIENVLGEMQNFIQIAQARNIDSAKAKEMYESLQEIVSQLLKNPDPTQQAIEVELVIDELNVLREEIRQIDEQCKTATTDRDSLSKRLQHEQNWVDKLRVKEENLTRTLDEKNEQLSSVKHELQLKERQLSDKDRTFQIKKGELEEEVKTLKKRYKTMMAGGECGHQNLLAEVEQLRHQIQVARNTVQYKEGELEKLHKEMGVVQGKLSSSNTDKLHNEILKLNIANTRLQGQLSGVSGEGEEGTNHAEERSGLLSVINQHKLQVEESNRKLYQAELRSETLVTAIDEIKSQHELERERYKRDLRDFHERVTTQKEQLNRTSKELEEIKIKYLETKKQKELAEEEAIRLGERVKQFRESGNVDTDKLNRLEKEIEKRVLNVNTLTEKLRNSEAKVQEQERAISELQRAVLALQQTKTTLQLQYSDTLRKYEQDTERFDSVKQRLKLRAKNYKLQFEKENSALVNKSSLLEEETQLLKLHVNKEELWRRTAQTTYEEWRARNRELETSCAALEEEVRALRSEIHEKSCSLATRQDQIAALGAELHHVQKTQQHYQRMYRNLDRTLNESRDMSRDVTREITHPINAGNVVTSTPFKAIEEMVSPSASPRERSDSDLSKLSLEEEGLTLDDPEKPGSLPELSTSLYDIMNSILDRNRVLPPALNISPLDISPLTQDVLISPRSGASSARSPVSPKRVLDFSSSPQFVSPCGTSPSPHLTLPLSPSLHLTLPLSPSPHLTSPLIAARLVGGSFNSSRSQYHSINDAG